MIRLLFGVLAASVFALAGTSRAEDAPTATEVIKKSIEANGGAEVLKKFLACKEKSKGMVVMNGAEISFTAETDSMLPDKYKQTYEMNFMGQSIKMVQIVNGEKTRAVANEMEIPLDDKMKEDTIESVVLQRVAQLTPLLEDKEFEVKLLDGKTKVADSDAYVLSVKAKNLREVKVFIDAKSFLITKIEKKGLSPEQKEGNQEMFLTDYKKIDGIMHPMKSKVLHDGKLIIESESTDVKILEKLPKADFEISD